MRYPKSLRLGAAILCLPLLSTACAPALTRASIARIERPVPPALPSDLTRTERLEPLTAKPSGKLMTIDQAIFLEIVERLAEAIGAVERGNGRAVAAAHERECLRAIFSTGATPKGC